MSAARVLWTLALPFLVQYCLTTEQLGPLIPFLLTGAALLLLMLRSGPPKTELERLTNGFGPLLAGSMSLGIAFVLVGVYLEGSGELALLLPALNNFAFLVVFAGSLAIKRPLVERFARLFHPDLSPEEVRYCSNVTWLWVWFFILNISIITLLAACGPLMWWTLYTGALSYVAAGALGLGEYVVRKKRFGRFTDRLHDRILRRWLGHEGQP